MQPDIVRRKMSITRVEARSSEEVGWAAQHVCWMPCLPLAPRFLTVSSSAPSQSGRPQLYTLDYLTDQGYGNLALVGVWHCKQLVIVV